MSERPTTLLLTLCGRKAYLARAARRAQRPPRLVGADADANAPARPHFDIFAPVPRVDAADGAYVDALVDLARREAVDAVVSLNDLDAIVLARAAGRLEAAGVRVCGPDADTAAALGDKLEAATWFARRGFATIATRTVADALSSGLPGDGPWIVKARHGQGSRGLTRVTDRRQLPFLDASAVVQPEIAGRQLDVDLLRDAEGRVFVALKEKLEMSEGTASLTRSLRDPDLEQLGRRLAEAVGHVGLVDADVILPADGSAPLVLEVNARVGGCFAHACLACEGLADAWVDACAGRRIASDELEPRPDVLVYRDAHPTVVDPPGAP